jgi:spermidine synthase
MFYFIVFLVATCSIVYELLLSTASSYLLWNSILFFSLTIGFFMFGLWIGSFFTKFVKNSFTTFLKIELLIALFWWLSVIVIKSLYLLLIDYSLLFLIFYIVYVLIIWALTGYEIPLIWNIVYKWQEDNDKSEFKQVIWDVFTYDYVWALLATFLFPFILLPFLWLAYTSIAVWIFNVFVAFLFISQKEVKEELYKWWKYFSYLMMNILVFCILLWFAIFNHFRFETIRDHFFYKETILIKEHSQYQEIVVTKQWNDIRLMLDWHVQFVSLDEYRYHNSLRAVWQNNIKNDMKILILWWWDWLLAKSIIETLSWKNFEITLVDLDPKITELAKNNSIFKHLNNNSLNNKNVKVINQDAFNFIRKTHEKYDAIIADFPDPRSTELAKLYTKEMYMMILAKMQDDGIFTTQAWNAFFTKESLWCIYKTIENIWQKPIAYHTYLPSFGDWWFVSFKKDNEIINLDCDYCNTKFDIDYQTDLEKIKINTLDYPYIMNYYLQWRNRYKQ